MPNTAELDGIVCAAVTPVGPDFRIDASLLAQHCLRVLDEGCTFVSIFGTTGEGASFDTSEKVAAMEALVAAGVAPERQIPPTCTPRR